MVTDEIVRQENLVVSFLKIFKNKAIVGSVAEKAKNNYEIKIGKKANTEKLHYFAIGHTFKEINTKLIFDYKENEALKEVTYFKFLSLQKSKFEKIINSNRLDILSKLIDSIRNINSHFIHEFDHLNQSAIDPYLIDFLKESFELALIQTCLKELTEKKESQKRSILTNDEKEELLKTILKNDGENGVFIPFIKRVFYQSLYTTKNTLDHKQKAKRDQLEATLRTKLDWIEHILFVTLEEDYLWTLNKKGTGEEGNHNHEVLEIKKGTYLSFEACLFLLTLFLYKNEANKLIPKIQGFKRNGTIEDQSKINCFTFFAKRFKSQDIDCNQNELVKFRDLIQYLNKYPTAWNSELEKEKNTKPMVDHLIKKIIDLELDRCFCQDKVAKYKNLENSDFKEFERPLSTGNNPLIFPCCKRCARLNRALGRYRGNLRPFYFDPLLYL